MAKHKRSEFSSQGKSGRTIDGFIFCLFVVQIVLLGARVFDHGDFMSWWLVFIPLYIICVPLLLIAFGMWAARH